MPPETKLTPMMEQYFKIKAAYPDAFLFYRLGDFYELFYTDAIEVSQLLELTLTSRNKNAVDPVPMCGVPYHAAAAYIDTLVEQGYKVAICEQVEDPKTAKGMVKREVVQLVTPGTVMEGKNLSAKDNNYLVALAQGISDFQLAYVDLSTGELKVALIADEEGVLNEVSVLRAKEVLLTNDISESTKELLEKRLGLVFSYQETMICPPHFESLTNELDEGLKEVTLKLLTYLNETQKRSLDHLQQARMYQVDHFLKLDYHSKANLELIQALRTGKKQGTLLWLLDETKTAMGGRLLKQWIDRPLIQQQAIETRQNQVASFVHAFFERGDLQEALKKVYDLERLAGRVACGNVNGRDLVQLKTSLQQIPLLRHILQGIDQGEWQGLLSRLSPMEDLVQLIETGISEDAPLAITEGKVIKPGFNEQLDQYREAMSSGKKWLAELEAKERQATGIKTLKIGFNRVFGYYIEITKANLVHLPENRYERKQTLANAERFISPELKEIETLILEAEEKSVDLEYQLFLAIREEVKKSIASLQQLAQAVSEIDVLQSFATVSEKYHYVRPTFNQEGRLRIIDGRHPVVEKVLGHQEYIPNSIEMDQDSLILLITGPNMSGKSTYMRQLALTVIMAQIGCFIPAESAEMPLFDQIFTRIGASDDLIAGQSTFMVEMIEANHALQHATTNSLILFDELGRGTATYDGMALAQAIIEYIHREVRGKTLFSTHYHELTVLEEELSQLKNVHVGAVEKEGELVFLHKMLPGPADKSYGIHVAKIAGLPKRLLERADDLLVQLENGHPIQKAPLPVEQLSLFHEGNEEEQRVLDELRRLNVLEMTPLDAMNVLHQLQKKVT